MEKQIDESLSTITRRGYCDFLRDIYNKKHLDTRIMTLEPSDFATLGTSLDPAFDPIALLLPAFLQAEKDPTTLPLHAADLPRLEQHLKLVDEFRSGKRDSLAVALSTKLDQEYTPEDETDHWIGVYVKRRDNRVLLVSADSYYSASKDVDSNVFAVVFQLSGPTYSSNI